MHPYFILQPSHGICSLTVDFYIFAQTYIRFQTAILVINVGRQGNFAQHMIDSGYSNNVSKPHLYISNRSRDIQEKVLWEVIYLPPLPV